MNTQTRGNMPFRIALGLGIAVLFISLLFENAGKVSFVLSVIGLIALVISIIYEFILHKRNKEERDS